MYNDDLPALVIPPEIQGIVGGNGGGLFGGGGNGGGNSTTGENGGLITPEFVSSSFDASSRTFTVTVNVKSGFDYELTVNSLSADAQMTQSHYALGSISLLNAPVTIPADQTVQLTVSGSWTQNAENYVLNNFPDAAQISVDLVNMVIDVNGITVQMNGLVGTMNVPLS